METDDRELVRLVLAGQTGVFRTLVERHQPAVFRFAWGLLADRGEAEDVSQEAFLAAFARLSDFDANRGAFATWLMTIARNRCINRLKRKRSVPLSQPDAVEAGPSADPLAQRELAQRLDDALAALPVEQRSAFVLAEIEGLPYSEIARIERTSLGTVKSRIHRAKQRLRSLLEPAFRELD